jgi:hypothetical protein
MAATRTDFTAGTAGDIGDEVFCVASEPIPDDWNEEFTDAPAPADTDPTTAIASVRFARLGNGKACSSNRRSSAAVNAWGDALMDWRSRTWGSLSDCFFKTFSRQD